MTQSKMSTGSALLNKKGLSPKGTVPNTKERMMCYKRFAEFFSYPKDENLRLEYDRLFRQGEIWLYGAEYNSKNEFQRAEVLSDIMGFYRAFGLGPDKDRPDALAAELEFMHYLIFKEQNAPDREKAGICFTAQKKFFNTHLYPAAKSIAQRVLTQTKNDFYTEIAKDLINFLQSEEKLFSSNRQEK